MGSIKASKLSEDRGFALYAKAAGETEYLTLERERELVAKAASGDAKSQDTLVKAHLRLVMKMAAGFVNYGHPLPELVAAGNVGLVEGASKFDGSMDNRFATYVSWWIKAALMDYVLKNASTVKTPLTKEIKSYFFKGPKARRELEGKGLNESDIERTLSERFKIPAEQLASLTAAQRTATSLSAPVSEDDDNATSFGDFIADDAPLPDEIVEASVEQDYNVHRLNTILSKMGQRESDVFRSRRLSEEPLTLEELAARYSVSRERIRQIEVKAFERVRKELLAA
jgi:RNA polymerase sigma-32 factor|nr:sigma-70 family RNA polymerase sigma factor [Neorhizobium tomejilense]